MHSFHCLCKGCTFGKHQPLAGQAGECLACAAGRTTEGANATSCPISIALSNCPAGSWPHTRLDRRVPLAGGGTFFLYEFLDRVHEPVRLQKEK